MKRTFEWDVFISHNRLQKPWVRKVVKQWRRLGLRVFFDEDSIEAGEPIVAGIERGLTGSRHVVFIISPGAVKSRWTAMEILNTIFADPDASARRVIPVLLEPTKPTAVRLSLNSLSRIDLTNPQNRRMNYHRLMKSLRVQPPFPNPPVSDRNAKAGKRSKNTDPKTDNVPRLIEVKLDRSFRDFSTEEQTSFLESLKQLLRDQNVKIISKRPGSVLLKLGLTSDQARRVLNAITLGYFEEHKVSEAKLLTDAGVTTEVVTVSTATKASPKALSNQSRIAAAIAAKNNISKEQAVKILKHVVELANTNAKNTFSLPGLGKLVLVNRKARVGRNSTTGEQIQIPAKRVVRFRVAKAAKKL